MRLIDADKEKSEYCAQCALEPQKCGGECSFLLFINRQKTVDPVKHGHWYIHPRSRVVECSVCNHGESPCNSDVQFDLRWKKQSWNYCPYCGAKMDEEVNGGKI